MLLEDTVISIEKIFKKNCDSNLMELDQEKSNTELKNGIMTVNLFAKPIYKQCLPASISMKVSFDEPEKN